MNEKYTDFIRRKQIQFENFDDSDLDPRFIKLFETRRRIKVDDHGLIRYGFVSVTTGWKPSFILMRTINQIGSCIVLSRKTKILALQMESGNYRKLENFPIDPLK